MEVEDGKRWFQLVDYWFKETETSASRSDDVFYMWPAPLDLSFAKQRIKEMAELCPPTETVEYKDL